MHRPALLLCPPDMIQQDHDIVGHSRGRIGSPRRPRVTDASVVEEQERVNSGEGSRTYEDGPQPIGCDECKFKVLGEQVLLCKRIESVDGVTGGVVGNTWTRNNVV